MRSITSGLTTVFLVLVAAAVARADLADQRTTDLLSALQANNFAAAEKHFDATMQAGLPPDKLEAVWSQIIGQVGVLKSFEITERTSTGGSDIRVAALHFQNSGALVAQVAVNASGMVGGLFFRAAENPAASPETQERTEATQPKTTEVPYIRPAAFTSRGLRVGSGEDALGATLTVPQGKGPFPGVVLVHGSGPNNRDEDILANHPFKDIAEGLSSNGIVVLRYDKRTWAHPGTLRPVNVDTETIDDAVAAMTLLRAQPEVNGNRVFVIGHSLGAGLAPEIAARAHADGVVMLAPPGLPVPQTIVRQQRYLHAPPPEVSETEKKARLIMAKSLPPDEKFHGAPASYWYDLDSRDEVGIARKLGKPILILRGERDYQVAGDDIEVWKAGLKNTPGVSIETLPRLNHLLIAGEGEPGPDEYSIPNYVAPDVIERIVRFINN